jgi:hypothetical protein
LYWEYGYAYLSLRLRFVWGTSYAFDHQLFVKLVDHCLKFTAVVRQKMFGASMLNEEIKQFFCHTLGRFVAKRLEPQVS